ARRARRIQRQVHGQSDGAARLIARHARRPFAPELSQFLLSAGALAIHRPAPCRLSPLTHSRTERNMDVVVRSALGLDRRSDELETFLADVIAGLTDTPKRPGAKYFYDAAGSLLFEEITRLPEYYPTRTEMRILREDGARMLGNLAPGTALI